MVLRWRPSTRAIAAGTRPPWRSRPRVYLSAKVIWRYVMAGFFLLVENRRLPSARSPFSLGTLLHLLYESALPNKRLKLTGGDRSKGSGVLCPWRGTDFVPHPCAGERVARSLSAIR